MYFVYIQLCLNYGLFLFTFQREVEILMFLSAIVMMKNRRACKIDPSPNTTQLHYTLGVKASGVPFRQVVVYTVNNHVILNGPQLDY